jgi:peroxiredoxin Q/BCP
MLSPGDKAPPFSLQADTGETVTLEALRGKKVVLYFYPKDDTPGCTIEACEFRDHWSAVRKTGAELFGVSPDRIESHQKFRQKFALPFPLLADPDHAVAEAYGAWGEKAWYGRKVMGILRTTVIINEAGKIARVFEKVKPEGHAREVLEALQ